MNTTEKEIPPMANMHEVVMKKYELIEKLVENKAKHDIVLAAAIQGYWLAAAARVEEQKQTFYSQFAEFKEKMTKRAGHFEEDVASDFAKVISLITGKKPLPPSVTSANFSASSFSASMSLGLVYPEDHSRDYERAIRMMEASIYDTVHLTFDQFDSYVLNNWEWKKNFIESNSLYVDSIRAQGQVGFSNVTGWYSPQSFGSGYGSALTKAYHTILLSGCGSF